MELRSRYRGSLLGLAVGDALGMAVEFHTRGTFEEVTDLRAGGVMDLEPGQWTDDTSMALCLAESLVETGGFDAADQMRRYLRWIQEGHLSSTGGFVDMGGTVGEALYEFQATGEPFAGSEAPDTAGNGSIMRLAPIPLFCHPDRDRTWRWAAESSRTTHGAAECLDACRLLADMIHRALAGSDKETILGGPSHGVLESPRIREIAEGGYRARSRDEVRGTGYVVESLEAALWCFDRADSFDETVLLAANLGDDADTTAAIAGQLAGAHHGMEGIRPDWTARIAFRERILELADALCEAATATPGGPPE